MEWRAGLPFVTNSCNEGWAGDGNNGHSGHKTGWYKASAEHTKGIPSVGQLVIYKRTLHRIVSRTTPRRALHYRPWVRRQGVARAWFQHSRRGAGCPGLSGDTPMQRGRRQLTRHQHDRHVSMGGGGGGREGSGGGRWWGTTMHRWSRSGNLYMLCCKLALGHVHGGATRNHWRVIVVMLDGSRPASSGPSTAHDKHKGVLRAGGGGQHEATNSTTTTAIYTLLHATVGPRPWSASPKGRMTKDASIL